MCASRGWRPSRMRARGPSASSPIPATASHLPDARRRRDPGRATPSPARCAALIDPNPYWRMPIATLLHPAPVACRASIRAPWSTRARASRRPRRRAAVRDRGGRRIGERVLSARRASCSRRAIGDDTRLVARVTLRPRVRIGARCTAASRQRDRRGRLRLRARGAALGQGAAGGQRAHRGRRGDRREHDHRSRRDRRHGGRATASSWTTRSKSGTT
jgi:hypothetical protein